MKKIYQTPKIRSQRLACCDLIALSSGDIDNSTEKGGGASMTREEQDTWGIEW